MAKKSVSTTPKGAPKVAPKAAKKAPAPTKAASSASPVPSEPAPPLLTGDAIGQAAGAVWQTLHHGGPQTLAALKKGSGVPGELAAMAVGWLAREGKLTFASSGKTVKVGLK